MNNFLDELNKLIIDILQNIDDKNIKKVLQSIKFENLFIIVNDETDSENYENLMNILVNIDDAEYTADILTDMKDEIREEIIMYLFANSEWYDHASSILIKLNPRISGSIIGNIPPEASSNILARLYDIMFDEEDVLPTNIIIHILKNISKRDKKKRLNIVFDILKQMTPVDAANIIMLYNVRDQASLLQNFKDEELKKILNSPKLYQVRDTYNQYIMVFDTETLIDLIYYSDRILYALNGYNISQILKKSDDETFVYILDKLDSKHIVGILHYYNDIAKLLDYLDDKTISEILLILSNESKKEIINSILQKLDDKSIAIILMLMIREGNHSTVNSIIRQLGNRSQLILKIVRHKGGKRKTLKIKHLK